MILLNVINGKFDEAVARSRVKELFFWNPSLALVVAPQAIRLEQDGHVSCHRMSATG